jgi:hypothetical protein
MAFKIRIIRNGIKLGEREAEAVKLRLMTTPEYKEYSSLLPSVKGIWWLSTKGLSKYSMAVVSGGMVSHTGAPVTSQRIGFRPVVKISEALFEAGDKVIMGDEEWTAIKTDEAVCDRILAEGAFSVRPESYTAFDFEGSPAERSLIRYLSEKGMHISPSKRWRPSIGPKPVKMELS